MMPRMHFSSTDLPVPEPPITTTDSAAADVEVDAVQHALGTEALVQVADPDLGRLGVATGSGALIG